MTTARAVGGREVTVPMEFVEGRPVVDVMLGSMGPYPFIPDTGASATVLNGDLVAQAGIAAEGRVVLADPSGGAGTPGNTHRLEALSLGGWTFRDVFAVSWSDEDLIQGMGGPRGVLGAPSLAGVTLEFDFPARVLRIRLQHLDEGDGSQAKTARSASGSFPVEMAQILDTVRIGGIDIPEPIVFFNERFATANIGSAALMRAKLTLDVGRRRLRLEAD